MSESLNKGRLEDLSRDNNIWLCILDKILVGLIVAEIPSGKFLWLNKTADGVLGRDFPSKNICDYAEYGAVHEDGTPYGANEYPIARCIMTGEVIYKEPVHYVADDGSAIILEVSVSRISIPNFEEVAVCTFDDVTEEYAAQRALKEGSERVRLALDAGAIVGTWIGDIPGNRVTPDERFAHTFGLDPAVCSAGFTPEDLASSIHPVDRAGFQRALADALTGDGAFRHQSRILDRDGDCRWVEAIGRVEPDESGQPLRFSGVLVDVSNWKEADEARHLLMREVDHRARNVLSMVQSVVRLTDAADPARYKEEVISRVDAMARAQSSLSRSNWQGGDLGDVVRDELSSYARSEQFTLTGAKVTVPAVQVQPLSMIMHEMVTNAVKHGALSASVGRVEISWKRHSGNVVLTWSETGGAAVEPHPKPGFGSRLLKGLADQLGGSLEIDHRPTGVVATLTWQA